MLFYEIKMYRISDSFRQSVRFSLYFFYTLSRYLLNSKVFYKFIYVTLRLD
jgi:hypothetical protein